MNETITITRKNRNLGFGYTSGCIQTPTGLKVADVEQPDYTGTVGQIMKAIADDRTLRSFESGGTYYNTAWFIKVDGQWRKIINEQYRGPGDLMQQTQEPHGYTGRRWVYTCDEITVKIK